MIELILLPLGVLLFGMTLISQAVRRLRQKLREESNPTIWTYVNELGGYFVVGVFLVVMISAWWIAGMAGLFRYRPHRDNSGRSTGGRGGIKTRPFPRSPVSPRPHFSLADRRERPIKARHPIAISGRNHVHHDRP